MTLKTRVIPILQWDGMQAVKTRQFKRPPRPVGSMMQHVLNMNNRNVDELIILDINATIEQREPLYEKIKEYTSECYMPVTYGGGVNSLECIEKLLKAGADKVAIKTGSDLIPQACEKFGAQAIVWVADHYEYINIDWNVNLISQFYYTTCPGEILYTSIDREGIGRGYGLRHLEHFKKYYNCPIIINGGCGEPNHMLEAINAGAHACAASSLFLFSDYTPKDCSEFLQAHGVETRI